MKVTKLVISVYIIFTLFGVDCSVFRHVEVTTEASDEIVLEKWNDMMDKVRTLSDNVMKSIMPYIMRVTSEIDLSMDCQASLLQLVLDLRQGKYWAIKMLDSFGKPFSGLTAGTLSGLGSYKICTDIYVENKYNDDIRGQYCLVDFRPPLPKEPTHYYLEQLITPFQNLTSSSNSEVLHELLKFVPFFYHFAVRFGICVPSTCSKQNVQNIASYVAKQLGVYANVPSCETKTEVKFNKVQLYFAVIFSLFVSLVIFATLFDFLYKRLEAASNWQNSEVDLKKPTSYDDQGIIKKILYGCSIRRNLLALFNTKTTSNDLAFLHGLKVFAITGVVISHVYSTQEYQNIREPVHATKLFETFKLQVIINGRLHVDTFVFVTSLLFSYLVFSNVGKVNVKPYHYLIFIVRRIWRLQPMMFVAVGWVILMPLMGSGPLWHEGIDVLAEKCYNNWWRSLLFLNNFITFRDVCLSVSWYVSMDMQLYLISLALFAIYLKKRIAAKLFLFVLFLTSVVPIGVLTYLDPHSYPPGVNPRTASPKQIFDVTDRSSIQLYLHLGVYAVGMATGLLFVKKKELQLTWWHQMVLWIVSALGSASIVFGTSYWNGGNLPQPLESAFYAGSFRAIWAFSLAWLCITCYYGYGGYVNSFLSWDFFLPISRLTYIIFLIHLSIHQAYGASMWGPTDYKATVGMIHGIAIMGISIAFSIVFHIVFECPLKLVDRLIFTKPTKTNEENVDFKKNEKSNSTNL